MPARISARRVYPIFPLLLMGFLAAIPFGAAQESEVQFELNPSAPTADDVLRFRLSGIWRDGCVPQSPVVSTISGLVRIQTSNSAAFCVQALTPWTLAGSAGKLAAGDYLLVVEYSGANDPSPVEIGRKALTVTSTSAHNEVVLPIVVNGSFAEKLHYQTIFTILNASRQQIQTSLQVYGNQGKPGGVFCAPIAPPPSSATSLLAPGVESFQFTSAINPSAVETATVRISLYNVSGMNANLGVPDSFEIRIPPLQRVSKFLWQLARESSALTVVIPAPESFQGSVILASDIPIAVGALHIMFPQGKFVAIPSFSPFPP